MLEMHYSGRYSTLQENSKQWSQLVDVCKVAVSRQCLLDRVTSILSHDMYGPGWSIFQYKKEIQIVYNGCKLHIIIPNVFQKPSLKVVTG